MQAHQDHYLQGGLSHTGVHTVDVPAQVRAADGLDVPENYGQHNLCAGVHMVTGRAWAAGVQRRGALLSVGQGLYQRRGHDCQRAPSPIF